MQAPSSLSSLSIDQQPVGIRRCSDGLGVLGRPGRADVSSASFGNAGVSAGTFDRRPNRGWIFFVSG